MWHILLASLKLCLHLLGMVTHTYNSDCIGGRKDRGILVGGQPEQEKLARPYLKEQAEHDGTCL
jgi:hypothetical protein